MKYNENERRLDSAGMKIEQNFLDWLWPESGEEWNMAVPYAHEFGLATPTQSS